jgi:hypothetical protein
MDQESTQTSVPLWFWGVAVVALLWNLLGMMMFFMDPGVNSSMMDPVLNLFPEENREAIGKLYEARPIWALGGFAIAVFGGVLGCIALLLRKKVATVIFVVSTLGVVVQNVWFFAMTDGPELMNATPAMPATIALIGVALILFSARMTSRGVLR